MSSENSKVPHSSLPTSFLSFLYPSWLTSSLLNILLSTEVSDLVDERQPVVPKILTLNDSPLNLSINDEFSDESSDNPPNAVAPNPNFHLLESSNEGSIASPSPLSTKQTPKLTFAFPENFNEIYLEESPSVKTMQSSSKETPLTKFKFDLDSTPRPQFQTPGPSYQLKASTSALKRQARVQSAIKCTPHSHLREFEEVLPFQINNSESLVPLSARQKKTRAKLIIQGYHDLDFHRFYLISYLVNSLKLMLAVIVEVRFCRRLPQDHILWHSHLLTFSPTRPRRHPLILRATRRFQFSIPISTFFHFHSPIPPFDHLRHHPRPPSSPLTVCHFTPLSGKKGNTSIHLDIVSEYPHYMKYCDFSHLHWTSSLQL